MLTTLHHISDNGNLEGIWKPRVPAVFDTEKITAPTDNFARICVAPTIHNCFQSIYRNISNRFNEKTNESLVFYVYTPVLTGNERVLDPNYLTTNKLVQEAHVTQEHCIIDPVEMVLSAKIEVTNIDNDKQTYYKPYDDSSAPSVYLAPSQIIFKVLYSIRGVSLETIITAKEVFKIDTPIYSKW